MKEYSMKLNKSFIIFVLFLIFSVRMFAMFMLLPVAFVKFLNLKNENSFLIGLAIGIYGLFQALFQIPFGILSDYFGRKPIIVLCLLLFFLGSVVGLFNESILGFIFSRALQGSGAVSSTIMAYITDIVEDTYRTRIMCLLGICFGFSFFLAIILGPIIFNYFGFHSLFLVVATLCFLCLIFVIFFLPTNIKKNLYPVIYRSNFWYNIRLNINLNTCILFFSIFCLHLILMLNFVVYPKKMLECFFDFSNHWKIYCFSILLSFLIVLVSINYLERFFSKKFLLLFFIFLLTISNCCLLIEHNNIFIVFLSIQIFFIAFNYLESFLPSLLSTIVSKVYKGGMMGFYSTSQFIGSGIGGFLGGGILYFYEIKYILDFLFFLCVIWSMLILLFFKLK